MVSLPPPRTVELFYDGVWNTLTEGVRESSAVTITRSVSAEGRGDPMAASLTLGNRSGDHSPRDPNSSLYGKIGRNTPVRIAVDAGGPHLDLPAGTYSLSTPDHAGLAVLGDIDVRLDVALDDLQDPQMLAIRWAAGGNLGWGFELGQDGQLIFVWSPTGFSAAQRYAESTAPVVARNGERLALRATLDVNNGAGGCTVTFYTATHLEPDRWTKLGDPVTATGTTSIFDAVAPLHIGDNVVSLTPDGSSGLGRLNGHVYGLHVYDGIDGTLVVDVDTEDQAATGDSSFTDDTGFVWTLTGTASLSNRHVRMVGEVPAWPPSRDRSGNDRYVAIAPAGILRRLDSGNKPLDSVLRRYIRGGAGPRECWPFTDGEHAEWATSLIAGARATPAFEVGTGPVQWGEGSLGDWIEPVALIPPETDATVRCPMPDTVAAGDAWSVDLFVSGLRSAGSVDCTIADRGAGNDIQSRLGWYFVCDADAGNILIQATSVSATTSSSTLLATIASPGIFDGLPHHVRLTVDPQASSSAWWFYVDGVLAASGTYAVVGRSVLFARPGWFANAVTSDTPSFGYLTYWGPDAPSASALYEAFTGFPGEAAGTRVVRLCTEQGVTASMSGAEADQTQLGVQKQERLLELLNTACKADLGYVLDQRDDRALIYRARSTLYNQTPMITLDYSTGVIGAPFKPIDDDKLTENDVTVQRDGGTKATAVLEEGRLSVQDPPDGVGRYDVAHTLSLANDLQPSVHAEWRMHLGTFDGLRYTKITLDLANSRVYAMIGDILRADVGDKIRLTNLPADHGYGDVDLIIRGYTEEIGAESWTITFTCEPGEPWTVAVADDEILGRADTAGCELGTGVDGDDTTFSLVTTLGPLWIDSATYPAQFPFDLTVSGEHVTVTACTSSVRDTFTRSVTDGWSSPDVGAAWVNSGGVAGNFDVNGSAGTHTMTTVNVSRRSEIPQVVADFDLIVDVASNDLASGGSQFVGLMARVADSNNLYTARAEFTTAAAVVLTIRKRVGGVETELGTFTSTLTHVAGTFYRLRFQGVGSLLRARIWAVAGTEPEGIWHVQLTDTALTAAGSLGVRSILAAANTDVSPVMSYDNFASLNPQTATVVRSVNGVVKSHSAGTSVSLLTPMRAAL